MAAALALRCLAFAGLIGSATLLSPLAVAAGGLVVSPTRVVLEGDEAAVKLTVRNTRTRVATYRLSLVRMRMAERGQMSLVEEARAGERFADGLVRFSPAELKLAPGVDQAVRLKARVPPDLEAGEYRSHLLFRPVGEPDAKDAASLGPLVGVTVPVIVRAGDVRATVRIASLLVVRAGKDARLEVLLERVGNASTYGNLAVRMERDGALPERVGSLGGVAVYVPNERRVVEVPIRLPEPPLEGERRLHVEYRSAGEDGTLLAERTVALPPS